MQSNLNDIFRQIKAEIISDKNQTILFVGTPCQVDGLKTFLDRCKLSADKVYFCDIVCHGVPSPGLWKTYIDSVVGHNEVSHITFKDKRLGWKQPLAYVTVDNKEKSLRPYTLLYFGELISRPCCAKCPYASAERISDITIGDHWGVESTAPDFYSKSGVSLVIVNTEKGEELFSQVRACLSYKQRDLKDCLQPNLQHPTAPNRNSAIFSLRL